MSESQGSYDQTWQLLCPSPFERDPEQKLIGGVKQRRRVHQWAQHRWKQVEKQMSLGDSLYVTIAQDKVYYQGKLRQKLMYSCISIDTSQKIS